MAAVLAGCGLVRNFIRAILARFLQAAATAYKPQVLAHDSHDNRFRIDNLTEHACEFAFSGLGLSTGFNSILSA